MTLDDIKAEMHRDADPVKDRGSNDTTRPWWIVLARSRPGKPPKVAFHSSHMTKDNADEACKELQADFNEHAEFLTTKRKAIERERRNTVKMSVARGVFVPLAQRADREVADTEPLRAFVIERPDEATRREMFESRGTRQPKEPGVAPENRSLAGSRIAHAAEAQENP